LKKLFKNLTFWVLASITAGILVGYISPSTGVAMQPLGKYFIDIVKLFINPIILLTIISGICGMSDLKKVGKIGGKAILYFEIVTTIALVIGVVVAYVIQTGAHVDTSHIQKADISAYKQGAATFSWSSFFKSNITIQVLVFAIIAGVVISNLKQRAFIISKIKYDLFEWMEDKKCEYGFILPAVGRDHPKVVEGLWNKTSKYISENNIKTQISINTIPDGQFYYTNFEIGKISSFSEGSQYYKFYRFIRSTGNIFIKRWGDAPIKMLGVNLFINKKAIRPVHGFVYQHSMTYNLNRLQNNNLCIFMFKVIRRLKKLYKQQ
jgi:hypothetical protein